MARNTLPRYEENRDRARTFVKKWQGERRERAEKDFFWNDFLLIFGVERRQVARFEAVVTRYSTGRHEFIAGSAAVAGPGSWRPARLPS